MSNIPIRESVPLGVKGTDVKKVPLPAWPNLCAVLSRKRMDLIWAIVWWILRGSCWEMVCNISLDTVWEAARVPFPAPSDLEISHLLAFLRGSICRKGSKEWSLNLKYAWLNAKGSKITGFRMLSITGKLPHCSDPCLSHWWFDRELWGFDFPRP